MLSLKSLIFTIFAVVAIWKGFSLIQRFSNQRQGSSTPSKPSERSTSPDQKPTPGAIELVPCRRCGAYVDPKQGCECTTSSA